MDFSTDHKGRADQIAAFFKAVFTESEGITEGALIGRLAQDLLTTVPDRDLRVYLALEGGALVGAIIFTPLEFEKDPRQVFLLSPVAVRTDRQGRGVGQKLLSFGLEDLRGRGVDVAVTYGSPDYYARVGFAQVTTEQARPPIDLSFPHGWLAQSLTERPLAELKGRSRCVPALAHPEYW